MIFLVPALLLGFLGSFHCIGMCGPIALTLPVQHLRGFRRIAGILLYNFGRITTYALMGALFGWLGKQFYLGGLQQWLSIALGAILMLSVFIRTPHIPRIKGVQRILGQLLAKREFSTLYAIGFFNGLLPCGLVYLGITGALATGGIENGMLFMAAFGAGTIPAMFAVSWFSQLLRFRLKKVLPIVMLLMGFLLIVRGMNLGIPYISPHIEKTNIITCHP